MLLSAAKIGDKCLLSPSNYIYLLVISVKDYVLSKLNKRHGFFHAAFNLSFYYLCQPELKPLSDAKTY